MQKTRIIYLRSLSSQTAKDQIDFFVQKEKGMDVKIEQDLIETGETIEHHDTSVNTIDSFNLYSFFYCASITINFLIIMWTLAKLWVRSGVKYRKE